MCEWAFGPRPAFQQPAGAVFKTPSFYRQHNGPKAHSHKALHFQGADVLQQKS
jgi:hypothetical protein